MFTSKALWILVLLCATVTTAASAGCVGTSVDSFGAVGNGVTDDTAAIQAAINAAGAAGGGSVVFSFKRYFTTGTLVVPQGVVLCGAAEGPFDVPPVNPATTTIAPTLLITNTNGPFITLNGLNAGVTDLLFYYPNQVPPSASAPIIFPFTIVMATNAAGAKVRRCTVINAYNFLDIEVGRTFAEDLVIGAFKFGVYVDQAFDHVTLNNILHTTVWNFPSGVIPPAPNLDTWAKNNGTAFVFLHVDGLHLNNAFVFNRSAGFFITDSPQALTVKPGYGSVSNVHLDVVQHGVVAQSTYSRGYKFTNFDASIDGGHGVVFMSPVPGTEPIIEINGGAVRGTFGGGNPFPSPAPPSKLAVLHVLGFNQ